MELQQTEQLFQVFVYGTLKKGGPNHSLLSSSETNGCAEYVCDGTTVAKFPLIVATRRNVPFLLNIPEMGHNISGEIYSIDKKMFNRLDELETYPTLYERHIFNVNGSDGNIYQCWTYILDHYPEDFVNKYQFLGSYQNSMEQPYVKSTGAPNDNLLNLVRSLDHK